MIGEIFAPFLGWFFGLVGREARAEIQRKKAVRAAKARLKKKKAKARERARAKLLAEVTAEFERQEKSERVQRELQAQIDGLTDSVAPPDPYEEY